MRLDVYMVSAGLAASREAAKRLIEEGAVTLDGVVVKKPAKDVAGEPQITVLPKRYVGRGGEKLEGALSLFGVSPLGLRALDIGASTGGFTDCLLQHGAAHVVALDAGQGQLHQTLREDVRVTNIEKYNARNLTPADTGICDMAVMDVSFISQTLILPKIPDVLREEGILISLIKPQFEAGRAALNKQGVVRHAKDRVLAVRRVLSAAAEAGLSCRGLAPSPILGGDGNEEFLAYFQKTKTPTVKEIDVLRVVLKKEVQI